MAVMSAVVCMSLLVACRTETTTLVDYGTLCGTSVAAPQYISEGSYRVDVNGEGVEDSWFGLIEGSLPVSIYRSDSEELVAEWDIRSDQMDHVLVLRISDGSETFDPGNYRVQTDGTDANACVRVLVTRQE